MTTQAVWGFTGLGVWEAQPSSLHPQPALPQPPPCLSAAICPRADVFLSLSQICSSSDFYPWILVSESILILAHFSPNSSLSILRQAIATQPSQRTVFPTLDHCQLKYTMSRYIYISDNSEWFFWLWVSLMCYLLFIWNANVPGHPEFVVLSLASLQLLLLSFQ